jgi:hypothetical protein
MKWAERHDHDRALYAARWAALVALLAGCTGQVIDNSESGSDGPGAGAAVPGEDLITGGTPPPGAFAPAPASLRKLTVAQYQNSLRDLLGEGFTLPSELEADTVLHGFTSIGAARMALSPLATEQLETAALDVAKQVFSSASRSDVVGCDPAGDAGCTRSFLGTFGRRAFRRPLSNDEVERYVSVANTARDVLGDAWAGVEYAVAGLLQSPNFLYRVELGSPDPEDPERVVFSDYELASRLSYFIWNSTPDDELLDAAGRGELTTEAGLREQAERLIASPRAAAAIETFFAELFRLSTLSDLPQLPSAFPQLTPTLGESMRRETLQVLGDVADSGADFRSIFDSRTTFLNAELASLYGVAAPAGAAFAKTTLPEDGARAGIWGHASFLAINAHATTTSPTLRGKFVREVLLCQSIPPPPPDVNTDIEVTAGGEPRTMREKLAVHSEDPTCAGCHEVMDPIGLGFENFDAIGAFRTTDVGKTIDASGELDGVTFADAKGLGAALKDHPDVGTCLARSVYRYAVGHLETEGEQPIVVALGEAFDGGGGQVRSLLLRVVESAGFRYAAPPE